MSESAAQWRIPSLDNTIPQDPTLTDARNKGLSLPSQSLEQMNTDTFFMMSKDSKTRWMLSKIGKYQDQINESASTHNIPPQLIGAVVINELGDIDWTDVAQQALDLGGSIGIAQIQIDTAIKNGLVIFPEDSKRLDQIAWIPMLIF